MISRKGWLTVLIAMVFITVCGRYRGILILGELIVNRQIPKRGLQIQASLQEIHPRLEW